MTSVTLRIRLLLLLGLAVALAPAPGWTQTAPRTPFVMAADGEPEGFGYRYTKMVYEEAFKRLGIPLELGTYTLARRAALVEQGAIDGETSRIHAYADAHPELIRVEEPMLDLTFSVFTANPDVRAARLEDLPANSLVEYRRGILMCEKTLAKSIPPGRLSTITTTEQGIRKLLAGRSDAFCDLELYVRQALNSAEPKRATPVRKLFDIASMPTYPYLARKHVDLAPRLAATLKQMKAEGLLDAYRRKAERDAGLGQ